MITYYKNYTTMLYWNKYLIILIKVRDPVVHKRERTLHKKIFDTQMSLEKKHIFCLKSSRDFIIRIIIKSYLLLISNNNKQDEE